MDTVAPVRLRVVFGDRLLTKSQLSDGLRRCWFLLRPELSTVSDLVAHLVDTFSLHRSCPDDLLLSMDGFVLPPFESTDVFRDKDVVRLKKKVVKSKKLLALPAASTHLQEFPIIENGDKNEIREDESVDEEDETDTQAPKKEVTSLKGKRGKSDEHLEKKVKKKVVKSKKLLALPAAPTHLQEFPIIENGNKNKIREDESVEEEDETDVQTPKIEVTRLKRKRVKSDEHLEKKKKKEKQTDPERNVITTEENGHFELYKRHSRKMSCLKTLEAEKNCDDIKIQDTLSSLDVDNIDKCTLIDERHDNSGNCLGTSCEPHPTSSNKKFPSRSACRKKAKRQWRREAANHKMHSEAPSDDVKDISSGKKALDQNIDLVEEMVPIIVRPGHIRFESVDEEGSKLQSNGIFLCSSGGHETLRWNGTTNKKKGQKWGREKNLGRTHEDDVCNEITDEKLIIEEQNHENCTINFESLCPLTRLPQEGDVVVYRLIELSSSWCPEISSFRVGKVYSYDPISMIIILLQIPEYPIFTDEKKDEECELQKDTSLYKDDGSLEIDYSSLIDIRLLKNFDSKDVVMNNNKEKNMETAPPNNLELTAVITRPKQPVLALPEESSMMGWDQIDQALKEKKAQLEKKHTCGDQTPSKPTRSYKGLRGSGLGHTLAFLRRTCDDQSIFGNDTATKKLEAYSK